jgi:hypothetical protein
VTRATNGKELDKEGLAMDWVELPSGEGRPGGAPSPWWVGEVVAGWDEAPGAEAASLDELELPGAHGVALALPQVAVRGGEASLSIFFFFWRCARDGLVKEKTYPGLDTSNFQKTCLRGRVGRNQVVRRPKDSTRGRSRELGLLSR